MSVDSIVDNSLISTTITIIFAQPGNLNVPIIGKESEFSREEFNLLQSNIITDITNVIDPPSTVSAQLFTKRLNFDTKFVGTTSQFLTTFNGKKRPGFYKGLKKGTFNFTEIQTVGALTALSYLVTTVRPLVT